MTKPQSSSAPYLKDKDLVELGMKFLEAFAASASSGPVTAAQLSKSSGVTIGPGGTVELTEEVTNAQIAFVLRAATLLKSKAAHEKAISNIGTKHAHEFVASGAKIGDAVKALIEEIVQKEPLLSSISPQTRCLNFGKEPRR